MAAIAANELYMSTHAELRLKAGNAHVTKLSPQLQLPFAAFGDSPWLGSQVVSGVW
jgi:hypothetical protein